MDNIESSPLSHSSHERIIGELLNFIGNGLYIAFYYQTPLTRSQVLRIRLYRGYVKGITQVTIPVARYSARCESLISKMT
jgi:hypothetical protein